MVSRRCCDQAITGRPNQIKIMCWRLVLVLAVLMNTAFSGQIVSYLPGFDGRLPFKLETGYISVEDSELFYYFVESQGNPLKDPLVLWLEGGPGTSSLWGLFFQTGPLEFDIENYTTGLPKVKYYPYGWSQIASILFIDAPVGTGFSYSKTQNGWSSSDTKSAEQSYQFLKKWLLEHPKYSQVEVFIAGQSYSGLTAPLVTQKVVDGNEVKNSPYVNIKGYIVSSPHTDWIVDENSRIAFAYRMALISKRLYKQLKRSCNGMYVNVDPSNTLCTTALQTYEMCVKDIYLKNILDPHCPTTLYRKFTRKNLTESIISLPTSPNVECQDQVHYVMSYPWANNPDVQNALHIRKGNIPYWTMQNYSLLYTEDVPSVVHVHRYLTTKRLQILVHTGDREFTFPFTGTENWIKSLNLIIDNKWRPWFFDDQVVGYTTRYFTKKEGFYLTFATFKGAGHTPEDFRRRESYDMFKRWVFDYSL